MHPGTGSFVQEAATALHEAGLLQEYRTTLHYEPDAIWQSAAARVGRMLGIDVDRELARRAIRPVLAPYVRGYPLRELVRSISSRLDRSGVTTDVIWEWAELGFDRWVSRTLPPDAKAVYGYEHACLETFRIARRRGMRCIYEVPAPEPACVQALLDGEAKRYPELRGRYQRRLARRRRQRSARCREEWRLADRVVANSLVTRDSYADAGFDIAKVAVIPLGASETAPESIVRPRSLSTSGSVAFLYAGTLSIRKGGHLLLSSWRQLDFRSAAELHIFGRVELPTSILAGLPPNVHFHGTVPQSELADWYAGSDVLVFPTLCDGFGLVVTEALAHGLPVITTSKAGAGMLVEHGVNGLRIEAGSVGDLSAALQWCVDNSTALEAMRPGCLASARKWSWARYRSDLGRIVSEVLAVKGGGAS